MTARDSDQSTPRRARHTRRYFPNHKQKLRDKKYMSSPELIAAVNQAIQAYEEVVGEYASRTRQMLDRYGYINALA